MSKTRVAQAATEHCKEVFSGIVRTPGILRAMKAAHQAFVCGAMWQREQSECRIVALKGRIKTLNARLEESNEHGRKENDHRYDSN